MPPVNRNSLDHMFDNNSYGSSGVLPSDTALPPRTFKYDLFLSYSTKPDYRLAREIEDFIESFHEQGLLPEKPLGALMVCRDGSEFILKKSRDKGEAPGDRDEVWSTILPYLEQSNYLLLLACPQSVRSSWVTREVSWFLKNRPENVWIAVTSGKDGDIEAVLPPVVVEHEIDHRIWFDFRAYRPGANHPADTPKVFEDELVRLVANLHGISPGELLPSFKREKIRDRKRRLRTNVILAAVGIGLTMVSGVAIWRAVTGPTIDLQALSPRTLAELENELDEKMPSSQPSTADLTELEVLSSKDHPILIVSRVGAVLKNPTPSTDWFATRAMAEKALELVLVKKHPDLPNTRHLILRQLALNDNYFFSPDGVVRHLSEIETPTVNDLQLFMGAAWEYISLGKYSSASEVLDLVQARMSDLYYNKRGGSDDALDAFRPYYERTRSALRLAEDVTARAQYLPVTAVGEIGKDTPASGGGLMVGDLIYGADGQGLQTPEDLNRFDWTREMILMVSREGAMKEIKTVLQGTLTLQVRHDCVRALRVTMVKANSPASRAGIKRGDILLRQGDQPIDSPPVLKHLLDTARGPLSIDLFSPESESFRIRETGGKTTWKGESKTVQVSGKELGIEYIPWLYSQPLLIDKALPMKAGW